MTRSAPYIVAVAACGALLQPLGERGTLVAQATPSPITWEVPSGFRVEVYADSVANAREMAIGPRGTVFVGSMRAGKVHALIDSNGDQKADRVVVIASGLDMPNGVAIRRGNSGDTALIERFG